MAPPFCVIAAPRSRTAWFSRYLSHGGALCEHEPSRFFRGPEDVDRYFRPGIGAADTMLGLKWRELRAAGVRLIAIIRPKAEVVISLRGMGLPDMSSAPLLDRLYAELDALPDDVPRYSFAGINTAAPEIFERLLGRKPPRVWTGIWTPKVIEADFQEIYRGMVANAAGFANFYSGFL